METIREVLMRRDEMTEEEAKELIADAREDWLDHYQDMDEFPDPYEFLQEWFGLEPDYMMDEELGIF